MSYNMTMLILSCDKFSDLWDGQIKLLEKNWPDREMETIIVTDNPVEKEYDGIKVFSAGVGVEWSDRLKAALEIVQTDFVFITLDDYYLIKRVDNKAVDSLVDLMEQERLDYIRLFKRPTKATREEIKGSKGVFKIDTGHKYSVNLYAGIWRKAFLESTIQEPKNAWQFEVSLPKEAQNYGAKCAVSLNNEYIILDVVRKGKLLHNAAFYFKMHPGIYTGSREVNSWGYEIRLGIKTVVGRYTPMPVHNAIKKVMRRFGYQFYSD